MNDRLGVFTKKNKDGFLSVDSGNTLTRKMLTSERNISDDGGRTFEKQTDKILLMLNYFLNDEIIEI
jgi:hypothetical protein